MRISLMILFLPLLVFSQDKKENIVEWNTEFLFESNNLNSQFLNKLIYGGYISNNEKNEWIQSGTDNNIFYLELTNGFSFKNNNLRIKIKDRNLVNSSFNDDFMGLILYGNNKYEDQNIYFTNTNIRADRFQQIGIDYTYNFNNIKINCGLSYLHGNQHASLIIRDGFLYTAAFGSYLDIMYDINTYFTNTDDIGIFRNNGNGSAIDINIEIIKQKKTINFYIQDLGFIKWKDNSTTINIDSNFAFYGVEIENILEFQDSIFEEYNSANYIQDKNMGFKSYIPANIGFSVNHPINKEKLKVISAGLNVKWQPYEDNEPLSFKKIRQGLEESNYNPYYWLSTTTETKYFNIINTFSNGGYSNFKMGLSLSRGKETMIVLGSHHFFQLLSGDQAKGKSFYFKILKYF